MRRLLCAFLVFVIARRFRFCKKKNENKQLAFRSCHALRERKLSDVRRTLGVGPGVESSDETTLNLDKAVKQHLKESAETFPMGDVERQVANQVCEYSCVRLSAYDFQHLVRFALAY